MEKKYTIILTFKHFQMCLKSIIQMTEVHLRAHTILTSFTIQHSVYKNRETNESNGLTDWYPYSIYSDTVCNFLWKCSLAVYIVFCRVDYAINKKAEIKHKMSIVHTRTWMYILNDSDVLKRWFWTLMSFTYSA